MVKEGGTIYKSLETGNTSLGENPAFPDEGGLSLFPLIVNECGFIKGYLTDDEAHNMLSEEIVSCSKIELPMSEMIETACDNIIVSLFDIPEDSISIVTSLHQLIDRTGDRRETEDFDVSEFTFDLEAAKRAVYRRRIMLSICAGAASVISSQNKLYERFNDFSTSLYEMYGRINALRRFCIYTDSLKYGAAGNGEVSVTIAPEGYKPVIRAEGSCAPFLMEMLIRGILELSISVNLPKDKDEVRYILGKSDFSMAEKFDIMAGIPLWKRICGYVTTSGFNMNEIGPNFLLMEMTKLDDSTFNTLISSIIKGDTTAGEIISGICEKITYKKGYDDFDNFVKQKNMSFRIDDEEVM